MSSREEKALTAALLGTGGLVAVPGLIAAPMLGLLGFGSLGPGAGFDYTRLSRTSLSPDAETPTGTVAALIQSLIGNVAAGSLFATLQSAGMGGAGTVMVNAAVSGAAAAGSALKALHWWKTSGDGSDDAGDEKKR
ncbi:hypothetical protein E4U22_002700 [Claviceps purpurea]|nr:hypothetical protein E4U22_002700 [Claviceps purpurea]